MKKYFVGIFLGLAMQVGAQSICGTDFIHQGLKQNNPEFYGIEEEADKLYVSRINEFAKQQKLNKKANIIYIPVVFHIIHEEGPENITQAQIMDQLRVLNEDFRKLAGTNGGSSTNALAADMQIEFRLAQFDPNGNRHDGIIRVFNSQTNNGGDGTKSLSYWPSTKYFNVWVVKNIASTDPTKTILGYAQFPFLLSSRPTTDGIMIRSDQVGTIQTGSSTGAGRTLTHEAGHWIGLFHTFQGGCVGGTIGTCESQGDRVCDTPPAAEANYGCDAEGSINSCSNDNPNYPDQIKNYMDYQDGKCANLFTEGQKNKALFDLTTYRSVLIGSANALAAGINADGSYVEVAASATKAPYFYGFEDASISSAGWRIQNLQNGMNAWKTDVVKFNGNSSLGFRNFNINSDLNARDEFNAPLIDLSPLANAELTFKIAYARKAGNTNDIFDAYISNDFGRTETRIFRGSAVNMETPTGPQTTAFVPTEQSQWRSLSVDLTPYVTYKNARIRFEFQNRKGNNIYMDDFTISGKTGLAESLKAKMGFQVYPNPINQAANISLNLSNGQYVGITMVDVFGRTVKLINQSTLQAGGHEFVIQKQSLASGVYFVLVETQSGAFTHKVVVN